MLRKRVSYSLLSPFSPLLLYCRYVAIGATRHQLNFSWPESAFLTPPSGFSLIRTNNRDLVST